MRWINEFLYIFVHSHVSVCFCVDFEVSRLIFARRWELRLEEDEIHARKPWDCTEDESLLERHAQAPQDLSGKGIWIGPSARKALGEEEWRDRLMIVRNIIIVFLAVVFFQIPFELLFASFNQNIMSGFAKYV